MLQPVIFAMAMDEALVRRLASSGSYLPSAETRLRIWNGFGRAKLLLETTSISNSWPRNSN